MKNKIKKIVLIGAGNLGCNFARALFKSGFHIIQVVSKTKKSAYSLAKEINSDYTTDLISMKASADLYIITVNDNSIPEVIASNNWNDKLVVHTSGSTDISVFRKKLKNYGVIYPLQTFSRNRQIDFSKVPLFIEANNKTNEQVLMQFTQEISNRVEIANSEQRLAMHIAAVFACNYSNYLLSISEEILLKNKLSFNILKPLICETIDKALQIGPEKSQTGPAFRNDAIILKKHLKYLKYDNNLYKLYKTISELISSKNLNNSVK